jgi:hypothetical protein
MNRRLEKDKATLLSVRALEDVGPPTKVKSIVQGGGRSTPAPHSFSPPGPTTGKRTGSRYRIGNLTPKISFVIN